jgi:hypothetical protein
MSSQRERATLFRQAVFWLEGKGGGEAVGRAFGDLGPLDAAWTLELPAFKEALRSLMREALEDREGAA